MCVHDTDKNIFLLPLHQKYKNSNTSKCIWDCYLYQCMWHPVVMEYLGLCESQSLHMHSHPLSQSIVATSGRSLVGMEWVFYLHLIIASTLPNSFGMDLIDHVEEPELLG